MKFSKILIVMVLVTLMLTLFVHCEDEDVSIESETSKNPSENAENDPNTFIPPQSDLEQQTGYFPSRDVESSFKIIKDKKDEKEDDKDKDKNKIKLEIGSVQDIILGFENKGDQDFNVFYIQGHLLSPMDFSYIIQNFTGFRYNTTIKPNSKNSILYRFGIDERLEPREYGIAINVYYQNKDKFKFAQSFFNQTVSIYEKPAVFDFKSAFALLVIFGIFGAILFGVYKMYFEKSFQSLTKKNKKKTVIVEENQEGEVKDEYLPAHIKKFKKKFDKDEKKRKKKQNN